MEGVRGTGAAPRPSSSPPGQASTSTEAPAASCWDLGWKTMHKFGFFLLVHVLP